MPSPRRAVRVAEAIREEVAQFVTERAKDPRILGMVTVTAVEVTRDLRQATIFVSILGSDEERATTMEGLESLSAHLRAHLGRELKLRSAPEIVFKLDLSVARAARIHELLHGLARDRRETDEPQSGIDPAAGEER